jgi:hypothetical protein
MWINKMHDWFGVNWSGWSPNLLLPYPYQEIVDAVAIIIIPFVWMMAAWLGIRTKNLYLRVSKEWQRLDEEAARNSMSG